MGNGSWIRADLAGSRTIITGCGVYIVRILDCAGGRGGAQFATPRGSGGRAPAFRFGRYGAQYIPDVLFLRYAVYQLGTPSNIGCF